MPLQELRHGDDRALQDIADLLVRSHKVIVITGAGISTSCGIPDFRSKDGLYNVIPDQGLATPPPSAPTTPSRRRRAPSLEDDSLPPSSQSSTGSFSSQRSSPAARLRGQDLFDSRVWSDPSTAAVFYQFIASLRHKIREEVRETSLTHKFIRALRDGGRLMRCYTQNIDGLEAREGLDTIMANGKGNKRRFMKKVFQEPRPAQTINTDFDGGCEVVQLHGELNNVRCTLCHDVRSWIEADTSSYLDGEAPGCEKCTTKNDEREAKGKRGTSIGLMRPNIVLYGEEHPSNHLLAPFVPYDISSTPEVLVIMGTSLKVFGLQKVIRDFAKAIRSRKDGKGRVIFVNRTKPAESVWEDVIDEYIAMDCDDWIRDVRLRREDLWLRQGELDLKATKPSVKRKRKDGDESSRLVKKLKGPGQSIVSVEIPRKSYLTTPDDNTSPAHIEGKIIPTQSPKEGNLGDGRERSQVLPSTPHHQRFWQTGVHENPLNALLSPVTPKRTPSRKSFKAPPNALANFMTPKRPKFSPLRRSFKPPAMTAGVPQTPQRPDYSPLKTPSGLKREVQVYADPEVEIPDSDEDRKVIAQQDEDSTVVQSPTKSRLERPLLDCTNLQSSATNCITKPAQESRYQAHVIGAGKELGLDLEVPQPRLDTQ